MTTANSVCASRKTRRAATIWIVVAGALLLPALASGDEPADERQPAGKGPQLVVHVYPVADLLVAPEDYPYRGGLPSSKPLDDALRGSGRAAPASRAAAPMGGSGGGSGGGTFSIPASPPTPTILRQFGGGGAGSTEDSREPAVRLRVARQLISLIKETIGTAADWEGEDGATCIFFDNSLVIRQTAEKHEAIAHLLQALRSTGQVGRSVTVEATWLVLTPQQLETLRQASAEKRGAPATMAKTVQELLRQATAFHGQITCLNRQQVHLATGRRQVVSMGGTPTVGVGAMGYSPTVAVINLGAVLQVTPTVSVEGAKVFVDLHSTVTQWKEPAAPIQVAGQIMTGVEEKKLGGPLVQTLISVDRADIGTQEWSSTVSIPIGRPAYVGSVSLSNDKASHLEVGQNSELALVIEVRPD